MKKLLTFALLFPVLLFAQQKSGDFITKYHFLKLSPSLLVVEGGSDELPDEDLFRPGIFATIGSKISRYTAVGFCTGYFNLSAAGNVIPLGVDFTFTDFEAKKKAPLVFAQLFYSPFEEQSQKTLSRYSSATYDIKGKYMYNVGVGLAFPAFNSKKMSVSFSYAGLVSKAKKTLSTGYPPSWGPSGTYDSHVNERHDILMLSLSFIL